MPSMLQILSRCHTVVYRATGGRIGGRIGKARVLILGTTGKRTGLNRSTPLLYFEDGRALVIVGSNGGRDKMPAWFHNLKADPAVTAQIGAERRGLRAREAAGAERERLWPMALSTYRSYETYQARTERRIPLIILDPAA